MLKNENKLIDLVIDSGLIDDGEGIEPEDSKDEESITEPFDPTKIRVESKLMTIDLIISRLRENEIDLEPGFQRRVDIWNDGVKSRLIESLLVRIPLPAFYMDATNEDCWLVVDGLQRLSTLKRFVIKKDLKLCELEFLNQFNSYGYDELPRGFQRRINETQVAVFKIEKGTPADVKYNIFKRINTGGLPLSPQEIRHALNQGKATKLLEQLATSDSFREATDNSVRSDRMADRELVLRFLAFSITPYEQYKVPDLDNFLINTMVQINGMSESELQNLRPRFERAMMTTYNLFGRNTFRKYYGDQYRRSPINKALFEIWSVNIDRLDDTKRNLLINNKETVKKRFINLMFKDRDFVDSISQSTGSIVRIKKRFNAIGELIEEVLNDLSG